MEAGINLYSARQAAEISGLAMSDVQAAIDRGHVKATEVMHGDRKLRMFTKVQLCWLATFASLVNRGCKPSTAAGYCTQLSNRLSWEELREEEYTLFAFFDATESPIEIADDAVTPQIREEIGNANMLDTRAILAHVEQGIRTLPFVNRYIELHPEKG